MRLEEGRVVSKRKEETATSSCAQREMGRVQVCTHADIVVTAGRQKQSRRIGENSCGRGY